MRTFVRIVPMFADIKGLSAAGLSASEIARRLGIATPTVAYHLARDVTRDTGRLQQNVSATDAGESGRTTVGTRDKVATLLSRGLSRAAVARELGLSKSTVSYHARRLGAPVDHRGARRYDWTLVQRFYDEGYSVRECQSRFGFSRQSWNAAVTRGAIVARPHGLPLTELLVDGVYRGRHNLKTRLVRSGLKRNECENCGLSRWRGRPLNVALHHVNGDRNDNRLENLKLLCPNCHSQTANFAGRKRGRGEVVAVRG
jgi:DNA-binding CsgD family transcriptional regulator